MQAIRMIRCLKFLRPFYDYVGVGPNSGLYRITFSSPIIIPSNNLRTITTSSWTLTKPSKGNDSGSKSNDSIALKASKGNNIGAIIDKVKTAGPSDTMPLKLKESGTADSKSKGTEKKVLPPGPRDKNLNPPDNIWRKPKPKSLGPGASKDGKYKVPEYYCYNTFSYYEMEIVMAELRIPQPVAIPKNKEPGPGESEGDTGANDGIGGAEGESPESGKIAEGVTAAEGVKSAACLKPDEGVKSAVCAKPVAGMKPAEGSKPAAGIKPAECVKSVVGVKPADGVKSAVAGMKPAAGIKPAECVKSAVGAKSAEGVKSAIKPSACVKLAEGVKSAEGSKASGATNTAAMIIQAYVKSIKPDPKK